MPIPSVYATRFFQLITARKFAEAERVLLRLREKIPKTEWNTGYLQALRGMLLAQKTNNDRYVFLSNLNLKNQEELQAYRKEFLRQARNKLNADYDRGYFAAWASYMRVLAKLEFNIKKTTNERQAKKEAKTSEKGEKKVLEKKTEKETKRKEETLKEVKAEEETGKTEKVKIAKRIGPRQSTLFDFSK